MLSPFANVSPHIDFFSLAGVRVPYTFLDRGFYDDALYKSIRFTYLLTYLLTYSLTYLKDIPL